MVDFAYDPKLANEIIQYPQVIKVIKSLNHWSINQHLYNQRWQIKLRKYCLHYRWDIEQSSAFHPWIRPDLRPS